MVSFAPACCIDGAVIVFASWFLLRVAFGCTADRACFGSCVGCVLPCVVCGCSFICAANGTSFRCTAGGVLPAMPSGTLARFSASRADFWFGASGSIKIMHMCRCCVGIGVAAAITRACITVIGNITGNAIIVIRISVCVGRFLLLCVIVLAGRLRFIDIPVFVCGAIGRIVAFIGACTVVCRIINISGGITAEVCFAGNVAICRSANRRRHIEARRRMGYLLYHP